MLNSKNIEATYKDSEEKFLCLQIILILQKIFFFFLNFQVFFEHICFFLLFTTIDYKDLDILD